MNTWPIQRENDMEMLGAIVRGVAQYILRGRLHACRPPHSDAQVLARTKRDLAEMGTYGYVFNSSPEEIAADAVKEADWQQDHNVNWDQWAFGH